MGAGSMLDGDDWDADASRYDRMNRTQSPDFAPGQDSQFSEDSFFADSVSPANNGMAGDTFSMGEGMDVFNTGVGGFGQPSANSMSVNTPQQAGQDASDKFWEATSKGFKASVSFGSELVESFKGLTPRFWASYGFRVLQISLVVGFAGIVLMLLGAGVGINLLICGLLTSPIGICLWLFKTDDAKNYESAYTSSGVSTTPQSLSESELNANVWGESAMPLDNDLDVVEDDEEDFFSRTDVVDDSDDEDDDMYSLFGESDEDDFAVSGTSGAEEGMSTDEALDTLGEINNGMVTRQYLWDMFLKVLPKFKPDFATMRDIDEDSDVFLRWGDYLREAAGVSGCKEENLPELLKLQENLFTVVVTCDRPQGFKPEMVANELANIYAYKGKDKNDKVFAKVDTVGAKCIITIFNGAGAMISLKDMMLQDSEFFLDSANYIPVALGVDQLGKVIHADLKNLESIIVTGMPRKGKSWFTQAILTQMCAFVPPSELNIYICDPKEGISDYRAFTLPHVKKFVADDAKVIETLRDLVKNEAPRRKAILGDAGKVNIWDFKKRYPDVKLPIIYVVIDEIVTFASRMDKDTLVEFRMLLRELISQLPALGIRAFLIPHILNNDIIEKKTSDLVPCKVSVCGDANHIEKATGAKPKEFPYKLVNKGDMAMKLDGHNRVLYIHGPVLTDSNDNNNEVFDYLRRCWGKIEPDSIENSVASGVDIEHENMKVLEGLGSDDLDSIDIFGISEDDSKLSDE